MLKFISSISAVLTEPVIHKVGAKLTSRAVVAPLVYSVLSMIAFALVYGLVGYKNIFEVSDENRDKNWENSITSSILFQANAGSATPINSLGRWLSAAQNAIGWFWFIVAVSIFI
jgi:hypothetical protein